MATHTVGGSPPTVPRLCRDCIAATRVNGHTGGPRTTPKRSAIAKLCPVHFGDTCFDPCVKCRRQHTARYPRRMVSTTEHIERPSIGDIDTATHSDWDSEWVADSYHAAEYFYRAIQIGFRYSSVRRLTLVSKLQGRYGRSGVPTVHRMSNQHQNWLSPAGLRLKQKCKVAERRDRDRRYRGIRRVELTLFQDTKRD